MTPRDRAAMNSEIFNLESAIENLGPAIFDHKLQLQIFNQ